MTKPTDKKLAIEWLRREKSMREGHEPTDYIDMAIESLKNQGCGCSICLSHNNMVCPKLKDGEYKTSKPDTDNLQKMLKDVMTDLNYWKDDAQVASEIIEKFYFNISGIYIKIENL